ncbi:hypothetical protein BDFB_012474, partial [Asbolus verrucosus]
ARLCKEHWWRCDGPCKDRLPFFGLVRRRIDRPPGPRDKWFVQHSVTCGGIFVKNSKNGDCMIPSSKATLMHSSALLGVRQLIDQKAWLFQEQFNQEEYIRKPPLSLVYYHCAHGDWSKSIGDPS